MGVPGSAPTPLPKLDAAVLSDRYLTRVPRLPLVEGFRVIFLITGSPRGEPGPQTLPEANVAPVRRCRAGLATSGRDPSRPGPGTPDRRRENQGARGKRMLPRPLCGAKEEKVGLGML